MELLQQLKGYKNTHILLQDHYFCMLKKLTRTVIPGFKEFLTEYTGKTAVGSTGYLFKVGLVPNAKETEEKVRDVATKLVAMKN